MNQISNNDTYYKQKYLKYKKKYLELKQYGGTECESKKDRFNQTILSVDELKELKKFSAYDLRRLPSWCDRILYRTIITDPKLKDIFKIEPEQYNSYVNNTIIKSDHDLVYGVFNITIPGLTPQIKVLIVTWNQANQNPIIDDVLDENFFSQMSPSYVNFESFDIICIAQQESSMYDSFINIFDTTDSLQRSIINKYDNDANLTKNYIIQHAKTGSPKFYVRETVLIKKSIFKSTYEIRTHSQCLKLPVCSKSICGIGFTFKIDNKSPFTLNFFATHMPINTSDPDLGLELRINTSKEIIDFIKIHFTTGNINTINQIDFISGDLNFRYNIGSIEGDQLKSIMKEKKAFIDFNEAEIIFNPTCKKNPCN